MWSPLIYPYSVNQGLLKALWATASITMYSYHLTSSDISLYWKIMWQHLVSNCSWDSSPVEKWHHTIIFFAASWAVLSYAGTLPWSFCKILDAWWWIWYFSLLEQVSTPSDGWTPDTRFFWQKNWQSKAIPISIHGDAVRDSESVESLSGGGGAPERGARPNSRQRQSLDILTIAVKVEVKQEEDEHAVVPVDENAPGPFTWPELQTAQMLINSRDFLSWLNHFPQLVSHNWNMRYYFPPLQMERTSHQPMTFLVKILMNPFQIL